MKKGNFILPLMTILFFHLVGCNEIKNNNESSVKSKDIVDNKQADTSFGVFWGNFQKAVVNKDFQTVIKLTKFPLETKGPQDEDKIVKYNESEFDIVFQTFLKENTDTVLTEFDLIKKLERFDPTNKKDFSIYKDEEVSVGEMVFRQNNGEWKLVFLYLYYGTIEEINNKMKAR